MPLVYPRGRFFDSTAEALVNPVNCVGVMGAGIALDFKQRYPINYEAYRATTIGVPATYRLRPGGVFLFKENGRVICNLATKDDWRDPSQLEWLQNGLRTLALDLEHYRITSVALPKIGCGHGGLDWETQVGPLVQAVAHLTADVRWEVYL